MKPSVVGNDFIGSQWMMTLLDLVGCELEMLQERSLSLPRLGDHLLELLKFNQFASFFSPLSLSTIPDFAWQSACRLCFRVEACLIFLAVCCVAGLRLAGNSCWRNFFMPFTLAAVFCDFVSSVGIIIIQGAGSTTFVIRSNPFFPFVLAKKLQNTEASNIWSSKLVFIYSFRFPKYVTCSTYVYCFQDESLAENFI